jgi:predicted TIM-barrel fold metal-dependent hydrolase
MIVPISCRSHPEDSLSSASTMGLNPAEVRAAVDLLGADHVVTGTDWPITEERSVPERLSTAFAHAGLMSSTEQQAIASGNVLRLIGKA